MYADSLAPHIKRETVRAEIDRCRALASDRDCRARAAYASRADRLEPAFRDVFFGRACRDEIEAGAAILNRAFPA